MHVVDLAQGPDSLRSESFRCVYWLREARMRGGAAGDDVLGFETAGKRGMFVVADGVGSERGGREAARELVTGLLGEDSGPLDSPRLQTRLESLHESLVRNRSRGSCTLVAALVEGAHLRLVHSGDSGAALVSRQGERLYATVGHGPAQYAIAAGALDAERVLEHDEHHIVTHVVGADPLVCEWAGPMLMRKSDTLVLASDGVLDNLDWGRISPVVALGSLARAAAELVKLVEAAIDDGGKDDDRCFLLVRRS